jgi:hypothetical protein
MAMPKRTNPFQKLSASIMAVFFEPNYTVEESILEQNPRTGVIREIDIRVTSRTNPNDRMMIECRDHARKQDVQWIDALDGKSKSLGFPRTVAVSSTGFTKSAIKEAQDRGITTLHLKQAEELDWRKWRMAISEFGISIKGLRLKAVKLFIPPEFSGTVPEQGQLSQAILVDKRDSKIRIPVHGWIDGILNDSTTMEELQSLYDKGVKPPYVHKHTCTPEMGLVLQGSDEFIPLVRFDIEVDYIDFMDKVPLDHFDISGNHILVGKRPIVGSQTKLILHDGSPFLSIMFEQEIIQSTDQQNIGKSNRRRHRRTAR